MGANERRVGAVTGSERFFVIAGEPSGDRLGAALIDGLRTCAQEAPEFAGVGGRLMCREGVESLFPMEELTLMGIAEVLPRIPALFRRIRETARAVVEFGPDALITIDSPDFNLRVAAAAKRLLPSLNVVHYVAPTVWAWRPGRARKMARSIDHIMVLLPFEPPYFQKAGMTCDFVGHPAVSEFNLGDLELARRRLRDDYGLPPAEGRLVALLPGSRLGELRRMGPVFGEVARRLALIDGGLRFVLPAAHSVIGEVRELVRDWPVEPVVLDPSGLAFDASECTKHAALAMSDAAFATSGTVALELAAARCPMVIGYRANRLTAAVVRRMATVDCVNLVNLLTETRTVPEFLLDECTPDRIAPALALLLRDSEERARQFAAFSTAMDLLERGRGEPGIRAARSVLEAIGKRVAAAVPGGIVLPDSSP